MTDMCYPCRGGVLGILWSLTDDLGFDNVDKIIVINLDAQVCAALRKMTSVLRLGVYRERIEK